jgi:hypothetical protein
MLLVGATHLDAPSDYFFGQVRPLCPGVSIGHPHGSVGTLGGFVRPERDRGVQCILSTATVLWPRSARKGDYIHQPGPIDNPLFTGETRVAAIAERSVLSRISREGIDAAYAEILPGIETSGNVIPEGVPDAGIGLAPPGPALTLGDRVAKIGRGTGYTTGRITAMAIKITLHSVEHTRVWNTQSAEVVNALEIEGDTEPFSGPGDTGAIVFRLEDFVAVGLLFGSSRDEAKTYAHDLGAVLRVLHLRLA